MENHNMLWSRRWSRTHGVCEKVQILGSAPVTATKAPHWRSPWAYCASLLPFRKESDDFGSPRSSVDDVLPPDTGRLSPWAWYLLGPTVAWAMQASKSVGPTVLGCRKAQMVASLMETGKLVDETIADTTQDEGEREGLRKRARKMAYEMAAHLRLWMHRVFGFLLTKVFYVLMAGEVYSDHARLEQLRRLEQTHTLVYVPTHKSYFDFMILPYVLFAAGLKVPHTVSGQNLRIPGVQFVMCRNGAFYIRRTMKGFTDAAIYKAVLQQYIREILLRRLSFCVYAEGGRSRDGRVQGLKMGLLSYLLDASLDAPLPQGLAFVPCAISYDKAPEEETMMKELTGKPKKKESFVQVLLSTARLVLAAMMPSGIDIGVGGRCGRAYVVMDEPIVVDQEIVKAARAALDAGEVLEGAPGEDELERALASLYDTAQLGGIGTMPREEAALTVGKLLPRGGHARKALVSHLAGTVQPMLVRSHAIPNSAVIAGALLAASQGLFVKGAPKRVGDGLQAQVRHLTGGVGAADIGAASRAIERALEHRGAIFAGLPESCGVGGDENPSLVFEHAKIAGKMLQADAATSTLRVVGTAEAWLHLTYRLNQLLPHFAKDGLVAAALATGPKERREAARRALELRELLRSELDHSALAPRELSEEEDFLALMDDMAARGALDRAGGGGVAAPASPGAPWEEAALGALLLQPALGTYAAVLRAGAAALAESGGMTEKELLQRIQGAIISASCVTEKGGLDGPSLVPGVFLVPSVVVVSNALTVFKGMGVFTTEAGSDSDSDAPPTPSTLRSELRRDPFSDFRSSRREAEAEVKMPRVESSLNLVKPVFGHHHHHAHAHARPHVRNAPPGGATVASSPGAGAGAGPSSPGGPGKEGKAGGEQMKDAGPGANKAFASTGGLRVGGSDEVVILGTRFRNGAGISDLLEKLGSYMEAL